MSQPVDERSKVYEILHGFSTAMFVTIASDGRPGARPMHLARIEEEAAKICFFTGQSGTLMEELQKDLWKAPFKVWFPGGPEDPEVALVAVQLMDAEYWDNRGMNKLDYLFEAAKAYVKGQKPEVPGVDQHAKTAL
jgi:general stress protein 26